MPKKRNRLIPIAATALALPALGGTAYLASVAGQSAGDPVEEIGAAASPALAIPTPTERFEQLTTTVPSTTTVPASDLDPVCGYIETIETAALTAAGFGYEQQLALANEWGVEEEEALQRAGAVILAGNSAELEAIVGQPELATYNAYWSSGYDFDQLMVMADEWGVDQFEAKDRAGAAILAGDTSEIVALVGEPKDLDLIAFHEAGYSLSQRHRLAVAWGTQSDLIDARVGKIIRSGDTSELDELVGEPGAEVETILPPQADPGDCGEPLGVEAETPEQLAQQEAFWDAGYSPEEMLELSEAWDLDPFETKYRAGAAILAGDTSEIEAIVGEPDGNGLASSSGN